METVRIVDADLNLAIFSFALYDHPLCARPI